MASARRAASTAASVLAKGEKAGRAAVRVPFELVTADNMSGYAETN